MAEQRARILRPRRPLGAFFTLTGSELEQLGGAFTGALTVAVSGTGHPVTAPWVSPGYRIAVIGDSFVPALLAVRAVAAGATVVVITVSPGAWQHLARTLGDKAPLRVLDAADAAQLSSMSADLVITDMPYTFDWIAQEWDGRCALITVMADPEQRAVPILRTCQLVVVAAAALPARTGSVTGALLGPDRSGVALSEERALLWADENVHEVRWSWTDLEAQALGIR